jgi:hypothetical protein
MQSPAGTIRWWLGKLAPGLLLAGSALIVGAFWLADRDPVDFKASRVGQLNALGTERDQVLRSLDDVHARFKNIHAEIPAQQERVGQADKIIRELNRLTSTWDKYVGDPEQQKANATQLERMTTLRTEANDRLAALQEESQRTTWERDGLEITLAGVNARLRAIENDRSTAAHYLGVAWRRMRVGIICVLALYSLGWFLFYLRRRQL